MLQKSLTTTDTNLNQVTLVLKMVKSDNETSDTNPESAKKSAEKIAKSSNLDGLNLSDRQKQILHSMDEDIEYSTEQVAEKIGLKGPRTRQLLNELVDMELLTCTAATKNRRYIKHKR